MNTEIEKYIEQYSGDLTRFCMSLCGNRADAEDLFQDTWVKAIRHFKRYRTEMPFVNWLFAICANTYKNQVSAAHRRKRCSFSSDGERDAFFGAVPDAMEDNIVEYDALHEAVGSLPKKQRLVVTLYYFRDFNIRDIAAILKIPEGTVKSRLSEARRSIKRRLENG